MGKCDIFEYYHPHPGKETCRFHKDAREKARSAGDENSWKLYLDTDTLEALQTAELAKSGGGSLNPDQKVNLDITGSSSNPPR